MNLAQDAILSFRFLLAFGMLAAAMQSSWALALAFLLAAILAGLVDDELAARRQQTVSSERELLHDGAAVMLWAFLLVGLAWGGQIHPAAPVAFFAAGITLSAKEGIEESSRWLWVRQLADRVIPVFHVVMLSAGVLWLTLLAEFSSAVTLALVCAYAGAALWIIYLKCLHSEELTENS